MENYFSQLTPRINSWVQYDYISNIRVFTSWILSALDDFFVVMRSLPQLYQSIAPSITSFEN